MIGLKLMEEYSTSSDGAGSAVSIIHHSRMVKANHNKFCKAILHG